MGTYYKGETKTYHSLLDNIVEVKKHYKINEKGFFGEKGKSTKRMIRQINCENPVDEATNFYNIISYGGIEKTIIKNNKIKITLLKDGTIITLRIITSTIDSPSVEINIRDSKNHSNIKYQKIHFKKKETK